MANTQFAEAQLALQGRRQELFKPRRTSTQYYQRPVYPCGPRFLQLLHQQRYAVRHQTAFGAAESTAAPGCQQQEAGQEAAGWHVAAEWVGVP